MHPMCRLYCSLPVLLLLAASSHLPAQVKSLQSQLPASSRSTPSGTVLRKLPAGLLKSIAAANYTQTGILEYVPLTGLELPRGFLATPSTHPRLLNPQKLLDVRRQVLYEPHRSWKERLRLSIAPYLSAALPLRGLLTRQAEDIKALAFLYVLEGDPAYRTAALGLLRQLPEPPAIINLEGGARGDGWGDFLLAAEALPAICVATDLLYAELDPHLRYELRRKITGIAIQLHDALVYTPTNNHIALMSIAILSTALLEDEPQLFGRYTRQELWSSGMEYLSRSLGLIAPDGGYAEGAYYGRYVCSYLAPLSVYMQSATGIQLFRHPYLERFVNWLIAHDKGNGSYSAFDDAFQVSFIFMPLLIAGSRQRDNWQAWLNSVEMPVQASKNLVEAIYNYPDMTGDSETSEPAVQFFPESGQMILRDRALNPQFFMALFSEPEHWFASRHEHIEPLSFELSAFGENLIVQGGYGSGTSDPNRFYYTSGHAKNGFLIDGQDVYRNPIWGDEPASSMKHSFRGARLAGTIQAHHMAGTDLQREILFIDGGYALLLDRFSSGRPRAVALNFNFAGTLTRRTAQHLRIEQGQAALNLIQLVSQALPAQQTGGYGLHTPAGGSRKLQSLQLEQAAQPEGSFFTILLPQQVTAAIPQVQQLPLRGGRGSAIRLEQQETSGFSDLAVNSGSTISTARWQSDARHLWVQYDRSGRLSALWLDRFTRFSDGQYFLGSSFPVSLKLERHAAGWQGYLSDADGCDFTLELRGFAGLPLQYRRQFRQPQTGSKNGSSYLLTDSGPLEIGFPLQPVYLPRPWLPAPDMLGWFRQNQPSRESYGRSLQLQRQWTQNQIAASLYQGTAAAMAYWGQRIFQDDLIPVNGVHVLFGVSQASYNRAAASTFSFRLPHRLDYTGSFAGTQWQLMEEGRISTGDISINNLLLSGRLPDGRGLALHLGRWYQEHQLVRLHYHDNNGYGLLYQSSANDAQKEQLLHSRMPLSKRLIIEPGYGWNRGDNSHRAYLTWGHPVFSGSFLKMHRPGQDDYSQLLQWRQSRWSLTSETYINQGRLSNRQEYRFSGYLLPVSRLNLSYALHLNPEQTASGYGAAYWSGKGSALQGEFLHRNGVSRYNAGFSRFSIPQQVSASLSLHQGQALKPERLQVNWNRRFSGVLRMGNALQIDRREGAERYRAQLYHQMAIPLKSSFFLLPLLAHGYPLAHPVNRYGGGVQWSGRQQYSARLLRHLHAGSPQETDYQIAALFFSGVGEPLCDIWFRMRQRGRHFVSGELGIQPAGRYRQPGLFYSWLRGAGKRLEASFVWHFGG